MIKEAIKSWNTCMCWNFSAPGAFNSTNYRFRKSTFPSLVHDSFTTRLSFTSLSYNMDETRISPPHHLWSSPVAAAPPTSPARPTASAARICRGCYCYYCYCCFCYFAIILMTCYRFTEIQIRMIIWGEVATAQRIKVGPFIKTMSHWWNLSESSLSINRITVSAFYRGGFVI